MAGFIPGFPVKCNFDGLSPVTFHFQPSSFVIFCGGGVVASLSLDSDFSTGSSSISLSLQLHFLNFCHFLMKHRHLLHLHFLVTCVEFPFPTANASCKQPFLQLGGSKSHVCSRSIYNLKIDTIYTYHTPFDRVFLQLSNGIRHVMPSTNRKLELQAKDIDVSTVWQPAVCSNGLKIKTIYKS